MKAVAQELYEHRLCSFRGNMVFIFSLIESHKLNDIPKLSEEPAQMYSLWQRL